MKYREGGLHNIVFNEWSFRWPVVTSLRSTEYTFLEGNHSIAGGGEVASLKNKTRDRLFK